MKTLILSMVLVSVALTQVNAQIRFGIKAGANISTFSGGTGVTYYDSENDYYNTDYSPKVGGYAGALVNFPIKGVFSLEPEVVFSMQGAKRKIDDPFTGESKSGNDNLYYVNIPIMAKFTFRKKFFVEAGPQIGILVSDDQKLAKNNPEGLTFKRKTQSVDAGIGIGGGYILPMGIGFNARYTLGVTKVFSGSGSTGTDLYGTGLGGLFEPKNDVIQLGVFYIFGWNSSND